MIFEWRSYDLSVGKALDYLALFSREGVQHATRHLPLGGYWLAESGPLNRIHHLWIYGSLAERDTCRAGLAGEAGWTQGFMPRGFPLIERQENRLMRLQRGSAALESVVGARRAPHAALEPGAALFAPGFMTLTFGAAPDEALAVWSVEHGDTPGALVALSRGTPAAPSGATAHHLLRSLSVSPLS
ncbi:NIPSNAP family protein [Pararhodobacter zhoushanensis]|uniref:NIPSNAP family protein n=1 Tax=Pararhodobacter zhoushanensis TaxID=2479545 RepID=UPI0013DFE99C|nr:NIPSNAP family protein [Pararhodobacter zhoushanensis]